uniref:Axonemal dynein light intermediate polypeptide 1 n=1 Tax=Gouania willdenowi TaxID=441366 RepID=A0A8C5HSL1_GOUWI
AAGTNPNTKRYPRTNTIMDSTRTKKQKGADSGPSPSALKSKSEKNNYLNTIFPSDEWETEKKLWVQQVSSTPVRQPDVVDLENTLDKELRQENALAWSICPGRKKIFKKCFDEIINQVAVNCPERGALVNRMQEEMEVTFEGYQKLYESVLAFGMRKVVNKSKVKKKHSALDDEVKNLEQQLAEEEAKCQSTTNNNKEELEQQKEDDMLALKGNSDSKGLY